MDAIGAGVAPPGWYTDPSGATAWRWWDGTQWTGYVSPPITTLPTTSLPIATPSVASPSVASPSVASQSVASPQAIPGSSSDAGSVGTTGSPSPGDRPAVGSATGAPHPPDASAGDLRATHPYAPYPAAGYPYGSAAYPPSSTGYPPATGGYPLSVSAGSWGAFTPVPTTHDRFATQLETAPWAKRAFVGVLVVTVLMAIIVWPEGAWLRSVVQQINEQGGSGTVTVDAPAGLTLLTPLLALLDIAILVVLLNWQFSAAKTAQMLGLPATHSPGLGVGSWFIPIVGLWFPYQALRDCLPVDDPARRIAKRLWMSYIGVGLLGAVTFGLSYARAPVAFATAEVAVVLAISVAVNGVALVDAVRAAHQRMLDPEAAGKALAPSSEG